MSDAMSSGPQKATANRATIKYSVHSQDAPIVGMTVAQVREKYSTVWSVPMDAKGYKGKEELNDSYVIKPGDIVELFRRQGEKGRKGKLTC